MQEIIPKMCNQLGVVLFEEFNILDENKMIYGAGTKFRFTNDSLQSYGLTENDEYVWGNDPYTFFNLARGLYSVRPLAYIPKKGERYSYIEWLNMHCPEDAYVTEDQWTGGSFDNMNLAFKNVFANAQIAKIHKQEVVDRILTAVAEATKND